MLHMPFRIYLVKIGAELIGETDGRALLTLVVVSGQGEGGFSRDALNST